MNFSLMIPTRKRPVQLNKLINSIFATTKYPKKIELRLAIDLDDTSTIAVANKIKQKYSKYNIFIHTRPRGNHLVAHYTNWLALNFCTGTFIIQLNDDCLFRTKFWDEIAYIELLKFLKDKPDGLVLAIPEDLEKSRVTANKVLASDFPIISKKAVETLGFFLDPEFFSCAADDDICKIYSFVNRHLDLRKYITIQHRPPEFNGLDNNYLPVHDKKGFIEMIPRHPNNLQRVTNITPPMEERTKLLLKVIENSKG